MSSSNRPSREKEILDAADAAILNAATAAAHAAASAPTDTTSNSNNPNDVVIDLGSDLDFPPLPDVAKKEEAQSDLPAGLQRDEFSSTWSSSSSAARRPSLGQANAQEEEQVAARPARSNFMRWLAAGIVLVGVGLVATGVLAAPGIAIIASAQPITTVGIALFAALNAFLLSAVVLFVDARARSRDEMNANYPNLNDEDLNHNHNHNANEDEFEHAHAPSQAAILAPMFQQNAEANPNSDVHELNGEEVSAAPAPSAFTSFFSFNWMRSSAAPVVVPVSNINPQEEVAVDATSSMGNSM